MQSVGTCCVPSLCGNIAAPSRWGKEGEFCGSEHRACGGRLGHPPLCAEKVLSLQTSVHRCCEPCRRPKEKATALLRSPGSRAPWHASSGHAQPSVEVGAILCFSFLQDAEYHILQQTGWMLHNYSAAPGLPHPPTPQCQPSSPMPFDGACPLSHFLPEFPINDDSDKCWLVSIQHLLEAGHHTLPLCGVLF